MAQKSPHMDIQGIILEAVKIVADKAVAKAGYDTTIQAQVISCVDQAAGKYRVRYQDGQWYAYSNSADTTYSNGSRVYVTIPGSDMSKRKVIIGSVSSLGQSFIAIRGQQEKFAPIGENSVDKDFSIDLVWKQGQATADSPKVITIYSQPKEVNLVGLDKTSIQTYLAQSDSFLGGSNILTNLSGDDSYRGDYGIVYTLVFKDQVTGEQVLKPFFLSTDSMEGNPYNYNSPTRQYNIFPFDNQNFLRVNEVAIYAKNFPQTVGQETNSISFSNFEILGQRRLSQDELNSHALIIKTPRGYIFTDKDLSSATRDLVAQLRVQGKAIDPNSDSVSYYWFVENASIQVGSKLYDKRGGRGWACLNPVGENGFQGAGPVYQVPITEVQVKSLRYKCVATYGGNTFSSQISALNLAADYDISIQTDSGLTDFYWGNGYPTLKAKVTNKGVEVNYSDYQFKWAKIQPFTGIAGLPQQETLYRQRQTLLGQYERLFQEVNVKKTLNANGYYSTDSAPVKTLLEKYGASQALVANTITNQQMLFPSEQAAPKATLGGIVQRFKRTQIAYGNHIYNLNVRQITDFAQFKCTVISKTTGRLLGSSSIVINNLKPKQGYYLVIKNGTQLFKYSSTGISPAHPQKGHIKEIPSLSFVIYDDKGRQLPEQAIEQLPIKWTVPTKDTMIQVPNQKDGVVTNQLQLPYSIQDRYSSTSTNNTIELQVVYKQMVLTARTNITFLKEGAAGTTGTDYVLKIVPNVTDPKELTKKPTLSYTIQQGAELNYIPAALNVWFKLQLWKNGQLIYQGSTSGITNQGQNSKEIKVSWSIAKNKYDMDTTQPSFYSIDSQTGAVDVDTMAIDSSFNANSLNVSPANLVKATVSFDGNSFYDTIPINTLIRPSFNYKVQLKPGTGFEQVIYSQAGLEPAYDSSPFEVIVSKLLPNGKWQDISDKDPALTLRWDTFGSIMHKQDFNWVQDLTKDYITKESSLFKREERPVSESFQPSDFYDGLALNIAIGAYIQNQGEKVGYLHAPVHFLRNKYFNSGLNGWDGNSISISEKGGLILSPQVGAGYKEPDNSFTGVFMGTTVDPESRERSSANQLLRAKQGQQVGLFSYYQGARTAFLDSRTGKAQFGSNDKAQIIIDPSKDTAQIYSGNYFGKREQVQDFIFPQVKANSYLINPGGMLLDLTQPYLRWGTGNFSVTPQGFLTAKGGGSIAGWQINDNQFYKLYTGLSSNTDIENAAAGNVRNDVPVPYNDTGTDTKTLAFWAGDALNKDRFYVTHDGYLRASQGALGSGNQDSLIYVGKSSTSPYGDSAIYTMRKSFLDSREPGFYLGTDGLSLGSKFKVGKDGNLQVNDALIQGVMNGGSIRSNATDQIGQPLMEIDLDTGQIVFRTDININGENAVTHKDLQQASQATEQLIDARIRAGLINENYLLQSDTLAYNSLPTITSYKFSSTLKPQKDQTYTVTIWGELGAGKESFQVYNGGSELPLVRLTDNQDGTHSGTFSWYGDTSDPYLRVDVSPKDQTNGSPSFIAKAKMEKGISSTVWLPHSSQMKGEIGADPITGYLTNQNVTLVTTTSHPLPDYSLASGFFQVYEGTENVSQNNVQYSITNPDDTLFQAKINPTTGQYTVTSTAADVVQIKLKAVYKTVSIVKTLTVSKLSFANQAAVNYYLASSTSFFNIDRNTGLMAPQSIVVNGMSTIGSSKPALTQGYYVIYQQLRDSITIDNYTDKVLKTLVQVEKQYIISGQNFPYKRVYRSSAPEDSVKYTPSKDAINIYVQWYQDFDLSGLLDLQTIPVVQGGQDTYKVEVHSTEGNIFKNGNVDTWLYAIVYHGSRDITNEIQLNQFVWKKVDALGQESMFVQGVKQVQISSDDVDSRATFVCEIQEI